MDLIRQHDAENYMAHPEAPMLFSNVTNWRGRPFMRLKDFILKSARIPNFELQAQAMAKDAFSFTNAVTLSSESRAAVEAYVHKKVQERVS